MDSGRWPDRVGQQGIPVGAKGRGRRRAGRGQVGQALVEFALVLPVLLLILAAIVDFGRLFYSVLAVHHA
ncbi:MAG: hypothetical protein DIU69_02210, partial [Bacillota bacterium]